MIYANLNKKSPAYSWLENLLQSTRVPLVSNEPAGLDELARLTGQVCYIVALNRLTRAQQDALIGHYAQESSLTPSEVEHLFTMAGGCPIPADAVIITAQARG